MKTRALLVPALAVLLLSAPVPAQRLVVSTDTGSFGALRGFDACTGAPDGFYVGQGSGGLANPRNVRPGPGGHLYVANAQNHSVLEFDANGGFVRALVPSGLGGLFLPRALEFGPDGNLYVTSEGNATQPHGILRYHGTTGALIGWFATFTGAALPQSLAFAPSGNLLVAGLQNHTVYELNGTTGAVVRTLTAGLSWPLGLAFGPDGRLYVASNSAGSVSRFDWPSGAPLGTFVAPGSGGLASPQDIVFGPGGNLLVAGYLGGGIKEYDGATGAFLGNFVTSGNPVSVAVQWPAGVRVYGQSTPGCAGRPCIGVSSPPVIGNGAFALTCDDAPPSAAGVLGLSGGALSSPLVVSGAGLWIDLASPFLFVLPAQSNAAGSASLALGLPNHPFLAGFRAFAQFGWSDACAPGGLSASRALDVTVQGVAPACGGDPYEPNDTCPAAAAVPANAAVSAVLCPLGDEDWYRFTLASAGSVTAQLTPPQIPCLDYNLAVFGACGTLLGTSAFAGCLTESVTLNGLCAGTYRIRVSGGAGAFHATAAYSLGLQTSPSAPVVTTVGSPGGVSFGGIGSSYPTFALHPFLQHAFTPGCAETVTVTVTSSAFQAAACFNPWMYARIAVNNGTWIIASTSLTQGTTGFTLTGTFNAQPGQTYGVMLLVSFYCANFGGPAAQVPAAGGTGLMTVTRTPM